MHAKRNVNIETLRSMAVFSVILIHMAVPVFHSKEVMNDYTPLWLVSNVYYTFSRFCVPIFFIIATYIAFNSLSTNIGFLSKVKRIGIPYVFWSALYFIFNGGTDFISFIKLTFTKYTSVHLWFLPAFLGFVFVLPAVKKIFENNSVRDFKYLPVLIFFFSIALPSLVYFLNTFVGNFSYLNGLNQFELTFPAYIAYALAFPYIYRKVNVIRYTVIFMVIVFINAALNIFVSLKTGVPNEFYYQYTTPLVFISSYVLFNIFMSINFDVVYTPVKELIYSIGMNSFGIYLVHWMVFMVLKRNNLIFEQVSVMGPIANALLILTISYVIVVIIRKIKFANYII
ncbi:acyltransferase [Enterobacter sp. ENT03]|uniref:acyltransferase n=1 Tax=Enterobacter sp. ENT03 TaxID=2854780 RepID=UPI001C452AB9|nr:acyltransferase family protein [Enterobacter sp. ENT03]MBV7404095.1 acyltransferase family protein [Enterobacter sp. ENT03]